MPYWTSGLDTFYMKWTEDLVIILKDLISKDFLYRDIAEKIGCTTKAVNEKARKLGIKSKYKEIHSEIKQCIQCNKEFKAPLFEKRKFCSKSCSTKFNNKNRKYSEEELKLKREQFNKIRLVREKPMFSRNRNFRICKKCSGEFYNAKPKTICEKCRYSYYYIYRPLCEFAFDFNEIQHKFENYEIVEKNGWYSPTNKKNNLDGVSKDHMLSVKWGFDNNISPEILKHPANCKLMLHSDNNKKKTNNSITYEELLNRIKNW